MAYFSEDFLEFFKELAGNNNKEWFDSNRKRYEKEVKQAFQLFIQDVITAVEKDDKAVNLAPKDAIFRINRDIRFSKDKTPYKLQVSAIISPGGRKDMISPGMYLELTPEHMRIYGGVYMPDKDYLYNIRNYISNNLEAFNKVINDKEFKSKYGIIRGEQHKILPAEFKKAAESQTLIYNKQFYYFGELPPETVLRDDLLNVVMAYYMAAKPVKEFFTKALASS
jgi:uncharacterized protein (TIGR02453 family)